MRTPRTVDDIDELVAQAKERGDLAGQAYRLQRVAQRLSPGRASLRAEALVAAGELLQLAGQPGAALEVVLEAANDGGPVRLDVRTHVAMARAAAGDREGARAALATLLREPPPSLELHLYVGQRCAAYGMSTEALTWLTRGVLLAERRGEYGLSLGLLLSARYGLREAQGLPADDWDRAAQRLIDELEHRADVPAEEMTTVAVTSRHDAHTVIDLVAL